MSSDRGPLLPDEWLLALERISELETRLFQENMKNDQQADRLAELEAEVERLREVDRSARAEDLRVVRMERVVEAARHLEVAFETRADDMFTAMDPLFDALRALDERDNQRSHE